MNPYGEQNYIVLILDGYVYNYNQVSNVASDYPLPSDTYS